MRTTIIIGLLTGAALTASPARSQGFEDIDEMDQRAALLAASLNRQAVRVDRRIKLPRCPELATIETNTGDALAVRCPPLGWRMRIALMPTAAPGGPADPAARLVVRRGDHVRLRVRGNAFVLVYNVLATADGRAGDIIPVRAEGSKMLLQAQLIGPGQAMLVD